MMTAFTLIVAGFIAGALPFSVWIGRLALRVDIRDYGDGNPGSTNVLRAGGMKWGVMAFILDFLKGAMPVALANFVFKLDSEMLILVALAPPIGHAFSPFLHFKGGKAVAVTMGIWCGLTIWEGPTIGGLLLGFWFAFLSDSGWAIMLMMFSALIYLLLVGADSMLLAVWAGNFLVFAWKHRVELVRPPALRRWYREWVLSWRSS